MSQGRILPLLGPAAVLYLVAEVIASHRRLDATAVLACALAVALSGVPIWLLRRRQDLAGARRVAMLCVLAGVSLVRWAAPELASLYLDVAFAIALPGLAAIVVHLASSTPDRPESLARRRRMIALVTGALALASSAAAVLAAAPVFTLFGVTVIAPSRIAYAVPGFAVLALFVALVLRLVRRRLGSSPEALASGMWAQLGLAVALSGTIAVASLVSSGTIEAASVPARGLVALSMAALVAGHVAMLGARRQVHAGRSTRRVLATATAVLSVAVLAAELVTRIPRDPMGMGATIALSVAFAALIYRAAVAIFDRVLAPFGGRLLAAIDEALERSVGVATLEELGAAVLPPLRSASGTIESEPLLFTLHPPRQVRVDAAGMAHVEERNASPAIVEHLSAKPGEVVVSAPLFEQVVRRPDLRALVDALDREDALCVVPLSMNLELEGLLIVPRGRRRAALTLEEIHGLELLGRHVSAQVSLLCAEQRARIRTNEALAERDQLEQELETAGEELARLRAHTRILKAGGGPARFTMPAIAYSPAMRALLRRVHEVAPLDAPVLLVGEDRMAVDQIGQLVHEASGRCEGPIIAADCAAVRPERAEAALFGEGTAEHPGWLRLAEGGTCLLLDVPALPRDAQARLAEAIATKRAHPADGAAAYTMDVRVVATSRVALDALVEAGTFDVDLHRRLEPLTLAVPPLRERREDLTSLVLLALDRSCRTAGRAVMGIDADALEVLTAHDWPGNSNELASVIERAVARASGPNVRRSDLPPLSAAASDVAIDDPFHGTFAEIEARVLEHAIARAGGNKSEAARMLGLKRTTFLDKLRRLDRLGSETKKQGTAA